MCITTLRFLANMGEAEVHVCVFPGRFRFRASSPQPPMRGYDRQNLGWGRKRTSVYHTMASGLPGTAFAADSLGSILLFLSRGIDDTGQENGELSGRPAYLLYSKASISKEIKKKGNCCCRLPQKSEKSVFK